MVATAGNPAAATALPWPRPALHNDPAITEKRMPGITALCAGGKVFPFPWTDALVVKLPAPQAGQLAVSGDATLSGPGHWRTSKTWAAVPAQARGRRERLAQDARAFVAG